jgi:G patch domain-containing protein 1
MDEEDIAELRENQIMSGIKEQQQRDVFGGAQAEPAQDDTEQEWVSTPRYLSPSPYWLRHYYPVKTKSTSSIASSIQRALMPPLEDSAGVRLLKKMGWRPGQGIGPRVSWRTRKIQDLLAAGKSLNGVDIDALDDDEEAKRHLYPPRDTVVPRVLMKTDAHGIGFEAAAGLTDSLGKKRPQTKDPKLSGE